MEPLLSRLSTLFSWLMNYTIEISILICLIFIIKSISKKLPAWWHYSLWIILLLRMIIPWQIESPLNIPTVVPITIDQSLFESVLIEENIIISGFTTEESSKAQGWHIQVNDLLVLLWLLFVIIFGIYISAKYIKFWTIIKKEPLLKESKVLVLLEECKKRMKSYYPLKITVTDRVKSPALFGYFRPRLLLPTGVIEKLDDTELSYIFMHELGHLKRHDIGVSWVVTFLQIFQWFNPFAWLAFHQMRIDQESACDELVLSKIKQNQTVDYAGTIIGFLENFYRNRKLPALVGILENQTQIKHRITTIVNYRKNSRSMLFFPAALLVFIGVIFFSFAGFSNENNKQPVLDASIAQTFPSDLQSDFEALKNHDVKYAYDASVFAENTQKDTIADQPEVIEGETEGRGFDPDAQKVMVEVKDRNIKDETKQGAIKLKPQLAFAAVNGKDAKHDLEKNTLKQDIQKAFVENKNNYESKKETLRFAQGTQNKPAEDKNLFKEEYNTYPESGDIIRYLAMAEYYREQSAEAEPLPEKTINTVEDKNLKKPDIAGSAYKNPESLNNTKGTGDLPANELPGEKIYSSKGVDKHPKVVRSYPVQYPDSAILKGIEGRVTVRFILNKEGRILNPQVVSAKPEGVFEQAALDTIMKYRFKPAMKDGKFVSTAVKLPIFFDIKEI